MPLVWASVRAAWADLPETEKAHYVDAWKQSPELVALGKQLQASSKDKLQELQAKMRSRQAMFDSMSSMMRMKHETTMNIIGNMGNTRYEYRWR